MKQHHMIWIKKILGATFWSCVALISSCRSHEKSTKMTATTSDVASGTSVRNVATDGSNQLQLKEIRDLIDSRQNNDWKKAGVAWMQFAEKNPSAALQMLCELNNTSFASYVLKENYTSVRKMIMDNSQEVITWVLNSSFTSDTYGLLQNKVFHTMYQTNPKAALDILSDANGFRNQGAADALVQFCLSGVAVHQPEEAWQLATNRLQGVELTRALRTIVVSASKENPSQAFALAQKLEAKDAAAIYPALFKNWFKNDAKSAMETLSSQPASVAISIFKDGAIFEDLSNNHSELLIDTLRLVPFQDSTKDSYLLASKMLARKNPELLPSLLAGMAPSAMKQSITLEAFTALTQQHPDLALKLANSLPESEKIAALQGTVRVLTQRDFDQALSVANAQDAATAGNLLREIARVTSVVDPHKATELLTNTEFISKFDEGFRAQFVDHTARNYAAKDLQKAIDWTVSLDKNDAAMGYQGLLNTWMKVDSIAASEWLSKQPAGPARDAGAQEIINQIKDTDPEMAEQWRKSMMPK